jgi:hypothetical protein
MVSLWSDRRNDVGVKTRGPSDLPARHQHGQIAFWALSGSLMISKTLRIPKL